LSATWKATVSTPSCTSFRSIIRAIKSGPISDTVARTGCPFWPYRSQNTVGAALGLSVSPIPVARAISFSLGAPGWLMPERSPFTSAQKTGTPASEKPCARICRVTVLPVPVAPAITPCRLALCHNRISGTPAPVSLDWPMNRPVAGRSDIAKAPVMLLD